MKQDGVKEEGMIKGLVSADTIFNELPEDTHVWVVYSPVEEAVVIVPDKTSDKGILWLFLKEEDAEHMAVLLMDRIPVLKDGALIAQKRHVRTLLGECFEAEPKQPVALVGPTKALEFFNRYKDLLPSYYKV
jgi:hypothetical protein